VSAGATVSYDRLMRVLVVEDEVKMASLVKRALEREGYAVDVAGNGQDGLWMASENDYDAIVLDVMIPAPNGFEVCRELRGRGRWAPVLLLTARDSVDDRVTGLDAGADDYLAKPFSFAELAARLRALTRGDAEIELSPKEFALLELFLRHPDEVLTRTAILEHAWDFAYDGTSNVVDVYVRYLREKIDRPFGRETIETVRGVGYRLRSAA